MPSLFYNGFLVFAGDENSPDVYRCNAGKCYRTARMKLYKGNCIVAGRKSPYSLYSEAFATFEKDQVYNQKDAIGFIKLNGLRLIIQNILRNKR